MTPRESLQSIAGSLAEIAAYLKIAVSPDLSEAEPSEVERFDGASLEAEEAAAMIEQLEDEGVPVPAEAYRRLGLDPPTKSEEPPGEDEEGDDQQAAEEPDPTVVVARRRDA
jgi:hypothetical protein